MHRTGRSQRAHAVLPSAKGCTLDQIADGLEVGRDAVSTPHRIVGRKLAWRLRGEGARLGRPPKVDAALKA